MVCSNCGRQLPEHSVYCNGCGAQFQVMQNRSDISAQPQIRQPLMQPNSSGMRRGPAVWIKVVSIVLSVILGLAVGGGVGIAVSPETNLQKSVPQSAVSFCEASLIDTMTAYTKARLMTDILLSENELTYADWNTECEATLRLWDEAALCAGEYAAAYSALSNEGHVFSRADGVSCMDSARFSAQQLAVFPVERKGDVNMIPLAKSSTQKLVPLSSGMNTRSSTSSLFKSIMSFPKDERLQVLAKLQQTDIATASAILHQLQSDFAQENIDYSEKMSQREDVMHKMQDAAMVIRTGAKVGVFLCGAALTGGASASGSVSTAYTMYKTGKMAASAAELGALVVSGGDLMLESGQNAANIIVGNISDKGTPVCVFFKGMADDSGAMRKVTEPVTAIINTGMLGGANALGRMLYFTDSTENLLNENKVLGIELGYEGKVLVQLVKDKFADMFVQDAGIPNESPKPLPALRPGMGAYVEQTSGLINTAKSLTSELSELEKELARMRAWYGDGDSESGTADGSDAVYPDEITGAHFYRLSDTVPLARSGSISDAPDMRIDNFSITGGRLSESNMNPAVNEAFTYIVHGSCEAGETIGLDMTASMRDREQDPIEYNILSNTLTMRIVFYDENNQAVGTPLVQESPENGKDRTLTGSISATVPENAKSAQITGSFSHLYGSYGNYNGSTIGIDVNFAVVD